MLLLPGSHQHATGIQNGMGMMPQTVPSPRANPCEFGDFAADAFDLSLLPGPGYASGGLFDGGLGSGSGTTCSGNSGFFNGGGGSWGALSYSGASDCEVPYSPTTVQQLMSLFCDATSSPPPMFPEHDKQVAKDAAAGGGAAAGADATVVKTEPLLGSCSSWENQSTAFLFNNIKQEQQQQLQDASVPQMQMDNPHLQMQQQEERKDDHGDHQLLREVLKDTSFQRKFNLKPFDLGPLAGSSWAAPLRRTLSGGSGGNGFIKMESEDLHQLDQDAIEPMISLAIQQMRNDIGNTCSMLGIAPDPTQWTPEDVRAWVMWTLRQFSLPPVQLSLFDMEGATLAALSEAELTQRAPQSGSLLFAQLEIWKASCAEDMDCSGGSRGASPAPAAAPASAPAPAMTPLPLHQLEVPGMASPSLASAPLTPLQTPTPEPAACSPHSAHHSSASSADTSDDEDDDMDVGAAGVGGAPTPGTPGSVSSSSSSSSRGSHIHLWQFLKELLANPAVHGSCVRWLDRPGGVFKIEDSVRVARLWGARKNRPAMNYDKLSRSIRQYYKKGIMKKTERSQRLVYQFCHPYSL